MEEESLPKALPPAVAAALVFMAIFAFAAPLS
jgi:hypothetical protein